MAKKPTVAGSVQGPAVADPALVAATQKAPDDSGDAKAPEGDTTAAGASEGTTAGDSVSAPVAAAQPSAAPETFIAPEPYPFPREVLIVNDAPMPHIVAGVFIGPYSSAPVTVRDEDHIKRIETDCAYQMELTPAYAELPEQPLRVLDAAAK